MTAVFRVAPVSAQSAGPGLGYPYVKQGTNIIVHCDEYGGFKKDMLFSSRVASKNQTITLESIENEKIPAQFEVKVHTTSYTQVGNNVCENGWRMPTYKEVLVVALLREDLADIVAGYPVTLTTTTYKNSDSDGWYRVALDPSGVNSTLTGSSTSYNYDKVICIRDIDTRSLGFSDL